MYRKNTAGQFIAVQGVDATTGGIKSGVSWTVRRCLDGTFAAATGTATEDGTAGWYKFALSQADTNGNNCQYNFTGTGAIPQTVNIVTTAADPTTASNFGITALPTANPGAAGGIFIAGTNAATTINGTAAAGATPATAALTLVGGAASTTGGGVAGAALSATGGAGAASTNGAAAGIVSTGGGTTTVSGADGATFSGTGNLNGVTMVHAGSGKDLNATTTPLTLAKTTNITGFNDIAASAVVSSGAITTSGGAVSTVTTVTNAVTVGTNNDKTGYTVSTVQDKTGYSTTDWTTQLTESYRANGAAPTPAQAVHEILGHLGEVAISGTTKTVKKLDHATTAETFTLDNASTPAAITRAT